MIYLKCFGIDLDSNDNMTEAEADPDRLLCREASEPAPVWRLGPSGGRWSCGSGGRLQDMQEGQ